MGKYNFLVKSLMKGKKVAVKPAEFQSLCNTHYIEGKNEFIVSAIRKEFVELTHESKTTGYNLLEEVRIEVIEPYGKKYKISDIPTKEEALVDFILNRNKK